MTDCVDLIIPFGVVFIVMLVGIFLLLAQIRDALTGKEASHD